jgi:hypothetical protein
MKRLYDTALSNTRELEVTRALNQTSLIICSAASDALLEWAFDLRVKNASTSVPAATAYEATLPGLRSEFTMISLARRQTHVNESTDRREVAVGDSRRAGALPATQHPQTSWGFGAPIALRLKAHRTTNGSSASAHD